jgi:hypothetical protein
LARIRSRWVAEIVDADPWAPIPYVATRYVPGLSLHDHVHEEGPITGKDLTWFATCLAEGVASVHAVGVLHRDVKPSNVLMEGRTPILIDFGLARVADDPRLTHTGWLLGTPGYLAPEILHGEDATPASDVHSWAATVAYAASGRPPFGRGPSMAIMDRVRRGEHDLSGIPDPLRSLLAVALDPEPSRRPSLDQVLSSLHQGRLDPPAAAPDRPAPEYTMPITAMPVTTTPSAAAAPTEAIAEDDPHTRWLTEAQTVYEPDEDLWASAGQFPARPTAAERSRAVGLLALAAVVCGAGVAAYPWVASIGLVILVWLLRSGSLAASATGDRRRLRGRRWYDGAQFLLRTPWELVRSIPGTLMLVLWAAGLAVAGALICYAVVAGELLTLFVCGVVFAVATWSGPGGSRVRSPLSRLVRPLSRAWKPWLAAVAVLTAAGLLLGIIAEESGTSWLPGRSRPLSGQQPAPLGGQVAR